jgi:cysteine synthase
LEELIPYARPSAEVGEPNVVDLGAVLDLAALGIPRHARVFALLGGHAPSGSLKDAAVAQVLDAAAARGDLRPGQPVAEISHGSTARSLVWAAGKRGSAVFLSFPGATQARIDAIVGAGRARLLAFDPPATTGHPMVDFFAGFEITCRASGYFYVDQTRNRSFALAYAAFVPEVLAVLERRHGVSKIDSLACGVGTGSTLMGLARGLKRVSQGAWRARIVGVEPARALDLVPPWEDLPGLRNTATFHWDDVLGKEGVDNYVRNEVDVRVEVSAAAAQSCRTLLADSGIDASLGAAAVLAGGARTIADGSGVAHLLILSDAVSRDTRT